MAEVVTQFARRHGANRDARLETALRRFGAGRDARGRHAEAAALFAWLVALKRRGAPIATVRRHVCHHSEGANDCAATLQES